ncbi:bleomycin resistance protein [Falsiroseomonas sp. E2-1-a20]|uniref:bleomycin resistance protein n=1 Tax=Falsiroseomonas sp. E2-1-a20 TaxID=3239300 RepID=UPI003F3056ED
MSGFRRAVLVPELLVAELAASLRFWCGLCGFRVAYDRPEDRFAYLDREGAQVMLEEAAGPGRRWVTGTLDQPFGRGMNLQIEVTDTGTILTALRGADWPLYLEPEEKWYRVADGAAGVRQFLVQDPDGYLLRFSQPLQAASPAAQPLDQAHWKL